MALNEVQKYIGIPYAELDCYQLVRKISSELFLIDLPDIQDYIDNPSLFVLDEKESGRWERVQFGAWPGDVVELGVSGRPARHVGIYIGMNYVLHTSRSHGSLVHEHRNLIKFGYTDVTYHRFRK